MNSANMDNHIQNRPVSVPASTSRFGRVSRMGCFAIGTVVCILVMAILYGINRWMLLGVDATETKPVVVSSSGESGDETTADRDDLPTTIDLADGPITARISQKMIDEADHPFDPLLKIAKLCLDEIDSEIKDYSATLVSQVRVDGELMGEKYLTVKIRHARTVGDREIPFSVYTHFLKPQENAGQEAIWVDGWHEGNLVAHTTGLLNVKRFYLDPDGAIAMKGNRYPIRDIGFRNLLSKMMIIGDNDRNHAECYVTLERDIKINDRRCTMLKVVHPSRRDHFDFHMARIYIDDERNIPIAYEGYSWPEQPGDELPLLEKYYYTDVQLNVGLTNADFDPDNEAYQFPKW